MVVKLKKSVAERDVVVNNYSVKKIDIKFNNSFKPFSDIFKNIEPVLIDNYREEGSSHKPLCKAKLAYNCTGIIGLFEVDDKFVVSRNTQYNSMVCSDSCVEFFCKPNDSIGYFNFEFNCCGVLRTSYIVDPERSSNGFKEWFLLPEDIGKKVSVKSLFNNSIDCEIVEPTNWHVWFFIPFEIMEKFIGVANPEMSNTWRGNFYKCADESSHPHWGSWNPVSELNFHAPQDFGILKFS